MAILVERRMKRWQEQRWILDNIIRTVGIEWDQPRIAYTAGPCRPEATFDFNLVRQRVTKLADMPREFAAAARRREATAEQYDKEGRTVAARESYFMASPTFKLRHTYQLFDQVKTPKRLVVYQGERHAIGGPAGGLGPNWMTLLAEWLRDRADGKPMASERVCVDVAGRQHVMPA